MHKLSKLAYANVGQFLSDLIFLILAFILAYRFTALFFYVYKMQDYLWVLVVYIPFWIFYMGAMGMYNKTTFNYYDRIFRYVLTSTLISGTAVAAIFYLSRNYFFSRMLFSIHIVFTIILLLIERFTFLHLSRKSNKILDRRVLVIGTQELIDEFTYYVRKTQLSMNITGYMQLDKEHPLKVESVGELTDLPSLLRENIVDEVIFAIPKEYVPCVEEYILLCEEMGLTARILLDLYNLKIARINLSSVGTMPMITYHTVSLNGIQLVGKRIMDILGAIAGLIITAVLSVFIIPLIKLDSPGPVFFRQDRVGLNGRVFKLYKFRSMYVDAEDRKAELLERNEMKGGLMFKIKKDPRITRVGKFLRKTSLDELPQFLNVIKGDMSLVGTRPPTPDEVSKYLNGHWRRISIKPGITGLWQVSGRSSILDFDDVVRLDTNYIDQWSITEDIKIIFRTIPAVIGKKGAM